MRLVEEYTNIPVASIEIKSANYFPNFAIRVFFNDGFNRVVNFNRFWNHPFIPSTANSCTRRNLTS